MVGRLQRFLLLGLLCSCSLDLGLLLLLNVVPRQARFPRVAMTSFASAEGPSLGDRVNRALALHKNGNTEDALEAYKQLVHEVPPLLQTTLYSNMGAIFSAQGEYEQAATAFGMAIAAAPESANAHYNMAVTLTSKLANHGRALKHCAIALRINPSLHKALHLMGNIMQELGRPEEAQKYFVKAEESAATAAATTPTTTASAAAAELDWSHLVTHSKMGDVINASVHNDGNFSMECISERPLIYLARNLLSVDECRAIIDKAGPLLGKSYVMGGSGDADADPQGPYRTSRNAWLPANDLVLPRLQKRLAALLHVDAVQLGQRVEELQVVSYEAHGQFKMHHDSSAFQIRRLTALLYLNSIEEGGGGETYFPCAPSFRAGNDLFDEKSTEDSIREALDEIDAGNLTGLKVRPEAGTALVFANHLLDGALRLDTAAVHAGLPVTEESTTKWIANYWIG